jgi:hypothetical protein
MQSAVDAGVFPLAIGLEFRSIRSRGAADVIMRRSSDVVVSPSADMQKPVEFDPAAGRAVTQGEKSLREAVLFRRISCCRSAIWD